MLDSPPFIYFFKLLNECTIGGGKSKCMKIPKTKIVDFWIDF